MFDPERSIEEFIEAVKATLQLWIDLHTNPRSWALGFFEDEVFGIESTIVREEIFTPPMRKFWVGHAYLDLSGAVARRAAAAANIRVCSQCGWIIDEYEACGEGHDAPKNPLALEDKVGHIEEGELYHYVKEQHIIDALMDEGFPMYWNAVYGLVNPKVEEMKAAIADIEGTEGPDLLVATMMATQIWHVSGDLIEDYGSANGLDYDFVDRLRNEGWVSVYGQEAVDEFLGVMVG